MSSGIRAQTLVQLQLRDFEIIENNIGHLTVYARTGDYYHTFCTPEATAAIQFYLNWRKEMGEELKPEAPLIRDSIRDGRAKKSKPLSYIRLWEIMQKLIRKANISTGNNYSLQPNHSFRKFMNTVIANAKANLMFKEIMLGHSLKLDNTYYNRDDPSSLKALLDEYVKAVDMLTINDEFRLKKEVVELREKLKDAPKLGVLQQSMVSKELQMDAIKRELETERQERSGTI